MRLFIAVDVNDEVRAEMRRVRLAIEAALTASRRTPRVTWVSPAVAHVTLRFVGEVGDAAAAALVAAFAVRFEIPVFELRWQGLGAFPAGRSPRTLWIGAAAGEAAMAQLASEVESRVAPIVGAGDARAFRGHLTLGRVRDAGRGVDWPTILAAIPCGPATQKVDTVTLYRSQLSPRGPTYTALKRALLA
jgi:2'-5' RNA ligase